MIIFSTPNGRSLSYLPAHGILMLRMIGAIPATPASNQTSVKAAGVIPLEAITNALATLKLQSSLPAEQLTTQAQHNSENAAKDTDQRSHNEADENDLEHNEREPSVASRAYPLLKLLEAAAQEQQPVMWQNSSKV